MFLDAAKTDQYYTAFELAASTGMRQSEILAVRRVDADLSRKMVSVRQAYTLTEKGHDFDDTKMTVAYDQSPFSQTLLSFLEITWRNRYKRCNNKLYKDSGLVIQTSTGIPVSPRNLMRNFYWLIEKIQKEVPDFPSIRFHDLRHTHATLLLKAGIHPKIVQEKLGHSSIHVTLDTYPHVLPNLQEAVLNNIGVSILGKEFDALIEHKSDPIDGENNTSSD